MSPARDYAEVRRWARTLARQLCADVPPPLGSEAWVAAPGPTRLASALVGAMCWLEELDPHRRATVLDDELQAAWRLDEADHRLWREQAGRVRALADQPDHAELQRRRAS